VKSKNVSAGGKLNRRDFIRASTAAGLATVLFDTSRIHAAGSNKIRVGIVGCGGRGTYDGTNCVNAAENVEITAMVDLFPDRLNGCRENLTESLGDKVRVSDQMCFVGLDSYKQLLKTDVDPVGVRSIIESSKLADDKKLTILTGTQMRRIVHIVEIMKRIHSGDIGEILSG
jgi:hypothetical protein